MEDVEMVDFQLGNFLINIHSKTARMLCEDAQTAQKYHNELRRQYPDAEASTSSTSRPVIPATVRAAAADRSAGTPQKIWTTSKNQTPLDLEAIAFFLSQRKELDDKFRDKKTANTTLWQQIAEKMNNNGYFVGHSLKERERCRQKFANLQQTYLKYIDRRRQTGEGKIEKPPFFDEMDAIMGKSDKTDPVLILDSFPVLEKRNTDMKNDLHETNQGANSEPYPQQEITREGEHQGNKFISAKKTVKPKK